MGLGELMGKILMPGGVCGPAFVGAIYKSPKFIKGVQRKRPSLCRVPSSPPPKVTHTT